MCEKCRFVSRTAAITTQPGVSSIELITDILRAEGWPKYVNPRTIAIEHAQEFSGTGIATTVGRVMPRIVCDDGDRYVKYNCTVYKKVTLMTTMRNGNPTINANISKKYGDELQCSVG